MSWEHCMGIWIPRYQQLPTGALTSNQHIVIEVLMQGSSHSVRNVTLTSMADEGLSLVNMWKRSGAIMRNTGLEANPTVFRCRFSALLHVTPWVRSLPSFQPRSSHLQTTGMMSIP